MRLWFTTIGRGSLGLVFFFFLLLPDWTEITFSSYIGKCDDGIVLNFPKLWNSNIQQPSDTSWQWRTSWNHSCSSSQSIVRNVNGDPRCNMSKIGKNTSTNVHVADIVICVYIYMFKNVYLVNKEFGYHFGLFNFKKHEWRTFYLKKKLYMAFCS